uniref:Uncharacterized protein n=1 Tax=Timema shepardi TaxID=629360 RepID=A0A7R9BAM9_TIMSH|nr:unnamed protein product [Timema shepardi]
MEGTAIPSVEDSPPRVLLEEMLGTPAGLMLVVEQEPDDPTYGEVETFPIVDNFPPPVAVPSHHHEQPDNKRKRSEKGTPQRAPKIQRLRNTIQESREQFAELQAGQTEVLRMIAENIIQQTSATKELAAVKDSIKELAAGMFAVSESLNRIADAINKK